MKTNKEASYGKESIEQLRSVKDKDWLKNMR